MRIFIALVIFGFLVLLAKKNVKRSDLPSYKMLICFIGYWMVSIILALGRIYDLRDISFFSFLIMLTGVISFSIGFMSLKCSYKTDVSNGILNQLEKITGSKWFFIILAILSIYVYSLVAIFFNQIIYYQSIAAVRTDYYAHELYGPLFDQMNAFLLQPFAVVCLMVFPYQLFYKRSLKTLLLGFYLFGYYSLGGGRIDYVRILLSILFLMFVLSQKSRSEKIKNHLVTVAFFVIVAILIIITSAGRMGEIGTDRDAASTGLETAVQHTISYSAGPIAAFDASLESGYYAVIGDYQYGGLTLNSAVKMANLFLSRIGLTIPSSFDKFVDIKQSSRIAIGLNNPNWNALFTANLYFFLDFGFFGVLLFPFFFGRLFRWLIKKMYQKANVQLAIIVNYVFCVVVFSVMDFGFTNPYILLLFIILLIWGFKKTSVYRKM